MLYSLKTDAELHGTLIVIICHKDTSRKSATSRKCKTRGTAVSYEKARLRYCREEIFFVRNLDIIFDFCKSAYNAFIMQLYFFLVCTYTFQRDFLP